MKIFISFNRYNQSTCKILREILKSAFGDKVEFYLSATDIRAGNDWAEDLRKNINDSDALISIVTPHFARQGWFYIEWSHFWLTGKPFFLLSYHSTDAMGLVHPMNSRQIVHLKDRNSIFTLFQELDKLLLGDEKSEVANYDGFIDEFFEKIPGNLVQEELKIDYTSTNSLDIERVLVNYYKSGEMVSVHNIVESLDDKIKDDVAIHALREGNYEIMMMICRTIRLPEPLHNVISKMLDKRLYDNQETLELIKLIGKRSQPYLLRVSQRLFDDNQTDSELFFTTISHLENIQYLKPISESYVEKPSFNIKIVKMILIKMLRKAKSSAIPLLIKIQELEPGILSELKNHVEKHEPKNNDEKEGKEKVLKWFESDNDNQES